MQLCYDASRFGLGLKEAVALAAAKGLPAVEYAFEPFVIKGKTVKLSAEEQKYLAEVHAHCRQESISIACLKLNYILDSSDSDDVKKFHQMTRKLRLVAQAVHCERVIFWLKPGQDAAWIDAADSALSPIAQEFCDAGVKLLVSLSTPKENRGRTLRQWRPLEPQEWRDLMAGCERLGLSFSAADCIWQNIDYLKILPGLMPAIEHVEANDVEINRQLLTDSGLFGPLWWRYRRPGKGQVDWGQLIEALKLYEYKGPFSIHLDDEFIDDTNGGLEESLDESMKLISPLLKY